MTDLLLLPHQASEDTADNKRKAEEDAAIDAPVKKSKLDTEGKEHHLGETVPKTHGQVVLA